MFKEFLDLGKEGRTDRTIDDTVVAGEAQVHAQTRNDLAVFHHRFLDGGSDG